MEFMFLVLLSHPPVLWTRWYETLKVAIRLTWAVRDSRFVRLIPSPAYAAYVTQLLTDHCASESQSSMT